MADDSDDKTEDPTDKKLSKAREEGNIAQTPEARILASLIGTLILVGMIIPGMFADFHSVLLPFIEKPHEIILDASSLDILVAELLIGVGKIMAVPFIVMVVMALLASLIQAKGVMFIPKKIAPDFKKINPFSGLKRMFSPAQLIELGKSLAKVFGVGTILCFVVYKYLGEISQTPNLNILQILRYTDDHIYTLIFITVLIMASIVMADFFFQRYRWLEKMKMSKQEVKDEYKNQEGDPQVKNRLRAIRMSRARRRMMSAVPEASVVVTNPTHYAVALKYDPESMNAPVLVAKGADLIAKRIREVAEEHDIPLVENPPLARALYAVVELDQEVPPDHYKAVAEVIGYVMRLKKGRFAN